MNFQPKNWLLPIPRNRLRMLTLYYYGQINGLLVCGTNQISRRFRLVFTKYGDGGVDVSPIADLYKTEVYAFGKTLDFQNLLKNAIPTDGLWDVDQNR